jgi:hypothetical protein
MCVLTKTTGAEIDDSIRSKQSTVTSRNPSPAPEQRQRPSSQWPSYFSTPPLEPFWQQPPIPPAAAAISPVSQPIPLAQAPTGATPPMALPPIYAQPGYYNYGPPGDGGYVPRPPPQGAPMYNPWYQHQQEQPPYKGAPQPPTNQAPPPAAVAISPASEPISPAQTATGVAPPMASPPIYAQPGYYNYGPPGDGGYGPPPPQQGTSMFSAWYQAPPPNSRQYYPSQPPPGTGEGPQGQPLPRFPNSHSSSSTSLLEDEAENARQSAIRKAADAEELSSAAGDLDEEEETDERKQARQRNTT